MKASKSVCVRTSVCFRRTVGLLLTASLLLILLPGLGTFPAHGDAASGSADALWLPMSEGSRLIQQEDAVRLTAQAAAAGDLFDFVYRNPVDPAEMDVAYRVVSDTTRGNGAHSRLNFYILPSADAALSDGVKIQLIQSALEDEHQFIVTGPDGGWDAPASFDESWNVNMRLYAEGANWLLNVGGARYQFSGENAAKLDAMKGTGACLRVTAHFGENGESALGCDVDVYAVDGVSMGKPRTADTLFASTKLAGNPEQAYLLTTAGLTLTGRFNPGTNAAFRYGLGDAWHTAPGGLSGFGMTMDISGVTDPSLKYLEVSFTNILNNSDRLDAWDSLGDAAGQPDILALTYRVPLTQNKCNMIVKTANGRTGVFDIRESVNRLDQPPYYEFDGYIPRADGVLTLRLLKVRGEWKLCVNGSSVGFPSDYGALADALNAGTCEVSVKLGSDQAADFYSSNGFAVPTDTLLITGIDGARPYGDALPVEPETDAPDPHTPDEPETDAPVWPERTDPVTDEITGELEFCPDDWVNIAPSDPSETRYGIDEDGLRVFGRNDRLGFSAGLSFLKPLELSPDADLVFTVTLPEEVYTANAVCHGGYCFFIGDATHRNFSEMKSIYLRMNWLSDDVTVPSASTPFRLEVILWDNTQAQLVMATDTVTIQPKTAAGQEREVTFTLRFEPDGCHVYANGQKATSSATAGVLADYVLNKMKAHYLACTFDYALEGQAKGAWTDGVTADIGATLTAVNGQKIINRVPDSVSEMTLYEATDVTETSCVLHWSKPTAAADAFFGGQVRPDGYCVFRRIGVMEDGMMTAKDDASFYVEGEDTLTFTDTGLVPDTAYFYTVYAVLRNENGADTELCASNLNKRVVTAAPETAPADTSADTDAVTGAETEPVTTATESTVPGTEPGTKPGTKPASGGCRSTVLSASLLPVLAAVGAALRKRKEQI